MVAAAAKRGRGGRKEVGQAGHAKRGRYRLDTYFVGHHDCDHAAEVEQACTCITGKSVG
jgi:hypothetical protein